jgi:carbonic anhydrase/acetyltransferase-like protein (isoleucine patch superfamily)
VAAYCVLRNVTVGAGSVVAPFSHLEDAVIGANCRIGPYARLRPGATLADDVHIGNFVETKKTIVRRGAKANHLAYLGDGDIGEGMTIDFDVGSRLNFWFVGNNQLVQYSGSADPASLKLTTDTPQRLAGKWDFDGSAAGENERKRDGPAQRSDDNRVADRRSGHGANQKRRLRLRFGSLRPHCIRSCHQ